MTGKIKRSFWRFGLATASIAIAGCSAMPSFGRGAPTQIASASAPNPPPLRSWRTNREDSRHKRAQPSPLCESATAPPPERRSVRRYSRVVATNYRSSCRHRLPGARENVCDASSDRRSYATLREPPIGHFERRARRGVGVALRLISRFRPSGARDCTSAASDPWAFAWADL
jgi:hypothetical protein